MLVAVGGGEQGRSRMGIVVEVGRMEEARKTKEKEER